MPVITDPGKLSSDQWTKFIIQNKGYIFQSPEMWKILNEQKHLKAYFSANVINDQIQAILVGYIQPEMKGVMGHFFNRAIVLGGPVIGIGASENDIIETIYSFTEQVRSSIYIQIRNLSGNDLRNNAFLLNNYKYEEHLNILIDLTRTKDEIFKGMHETRRKQIRRSYNRGVSCKIIHDYTPDLLVGLYPILSGLYKKLSLPLIPYSFLDCTMKTLMPKGMLKVFLAIYSTSVIGFRIVLTYNQTIYDWYAASHEKHNDKYVNDLLPWEILCWGNINHFKFFDFGGAGSPNIPYGVRDFKIKFGGDLVNFGRFQHVNKPMLMKIGETGMKVLNSIR